MRPLAFGLLGPLDIRLDGRIVEIGSRKQRMLLSALLVTPDQPVSTDALVELMWGASPPASVSVTLRSVASRLRRMLGDEGDLVRAGPGGYLARVDRDMIDIHVFEELAARGRALLADDRLGEAITLLTRALGLWRGPALPEIADAAAARPVVERLTALRRTVVEELAAAHLAVDDPATALSVLEPHLTDDPLSERARGQQMVAMYRLGRQTEALSAYRALRAGLQDELGVEPHPDLRRLQQQILRHDRALNPARRATRHLPTALTPLVGRDADRAQLTALLRTSRLLTLTGVGGVGKTRLALQVASDLLDHFRGDVQMVEFALEPDADHLAARLAEACGLVVPGDADPLDRITDALHDRHLLVVVDSCEHVVTAAANLIHRLLRAVPGLTVLATSRTPLQLTGEMIYPVGPLSVPHPDADEPAQLAASDAVTLFCQRARDAQAGFGLTADNAPAVARICRHLDGLPLALELAASRMRALSTQQLAERLADRFQLLTAGDPNAPARQHTLRATIDWSYRLLSEAERAALRALTAFPADFDLDAADAVIGPAAPTDVIFQLVDKSVVTPRHRSGRVRYELLESIRAFAAGQLAADELATARLRHLNHYAALVERERLQQTNWDSVAWCRTVMADERNLRAAISCALAARDTDAALRTACGYWVYCLWGGRSEPLDWLSDALATDRGGDVGARCEGLIALAVFTTWWELGPPHRSAALFDEALSLADRAGDDHSRARARYFDAEYRLLRGRREDARVEYRDAIRIAGDRGVARWCHHSLAWIALAEDDHERAIDELRRALHSGASDELIVPHALAALAPLTAADGRSAHAITLAQRAVEAAVPFQLPGIQVMALLRAAQTHTLCLADTSDGTDPGVVALGRTLSDLFDRLHRAGIRQFVAEALHLVAVHADRRHAPDDAARYLTAGDALHAARSEAPTCLPALTRIIDDTRSHVRHELGEPALDIVTAETAAEPLRDIVARARRQLVDESDDYRGTVRSRA